MTHLELFAWKHDGSGRTYLVARDDARGREDIDREAFRLVANPSIDRCQVDRSVRIAGYTGRRS